MYDFTSVRIYCELVWLKIRTVSLFSLPYWILICAPEWNTCKSIFTAVLYYGLIHFTVRTAHQCFMQIISHFNKIDEFMGHRKPTNGLM